MSASESRIIARAWLSVAEGTLEAAGGARQAGHWRSSVSRSYYAAYGFLAAALVYKGVSFGAGREGPGHEPLPDLIRDNLKSVMGKKARTQVRIGITALYSLRLEADYRPRATIRESEAVKALREASTIADNVRKLCI